MHLTLVQLRVLWKIRGSFQYCWYYAGARQRGKKQTRTMVAWQQGRTIYMKLLLDSSTDSKIVTRTNQNHASFASIFLLKCWVWWKGGVCRFSANNFLLCTDPQRHGAAGGSDSYDRHLVNGLLTSCLCGAFQVSFCLFRISLQVIIIFKVGAVQVMVLKRFFITVPTSSRLKMST